MIRRDRERKGGQRLRELIQEGIDSGPPKPLPKDWKQRMRAAGRQFARELKQRKGRPNAATKNGRSSSKG